MCVSSQIHVLHDQLFGSLRDSVGRKGVRGSGGEMEIWGGEGEGGVWGGLVPVAESVMIVRVSNVNDKQKCNMSVLQYCSHVT